MLRHYHARWTELLHSLERWFWHGFLTPVLQIRHLTGELQPLLISIFAHFTCEELALGAARCIRSVSRTATWTAKFDSHTAVLDLLRVHETTPHSPSRTEIKFITVTVFSNPPWPCSARGRITIIQTLPSLHQHYSLRQQLIPAALWTVVSTPSCGRLPVAPPSDQ